MRKDVRLRMSEMNLLACKGGAAAADDLWSIPSTVGDKVVRGRAALLALPIDSALKPHANQRHRFRDHVARISSHAVPRESHPSAERSARAAVARTAPQAPPPSHRPRC